MKDENYRATLKDMNNNASLSEYVDISWRLNTLEVIMDAIFHRHGNCQTDMWTLLLI